MIKLLAKLLRVLNSETDPGQISLGLCFAMIVGLTPFMSLHNLFVVLLVLVLRVNLSAFLLGLALFTGIAYLLDPLFHRLGLAVLTAPSLADLWTSLYQSVWWRLEHFNNSIVMGSLVFSVAMFVPVLLLLNLLIRRYRQHVMAWVQKTRIMQMFKASKLYQTYETLSSWRPG
ncbi:TIGR03546 family protein [Candidatus Nitrospira neomarina]|uniref:TIGR03546 family protein n=1 Tax=Candidatus Nitrospira neomarina TaxID=3020899 RepID=A0AA96JYJ9_9BACT|nr:TIGR03546 family protein [Candidatus Nitrospira neomarina]WNM60211.1 TIGR03546 family protein [Candidatus Nitrospira neomarina]